MKQIPVLLLTGYLGSGKTTLLNRILANRKGIRFAVIVNDIGEVNIDAELVERGGVVNKSDDSLVALQNGCICCTLKTDLIQQLEELADMERFDYIVIEASGICEPVPIAQTICSIPYLEPEYRHKAVPVLDCIVSMVDALRMKDEFQGGLDLRRQNIGEDDIENLLIQQIEFCNIILLNKVDEVEPAQLGRLKEIVRAIQPKAEIIGCNFGDVDLDKIVGTHLFDFDEVATSAAWIREIEGDGGEHDEDEHHHHEHGEHHGHEEHCHDGHGEHGHHHEHEAEDQDSGHHHHHHHHGEGEVEEYGIGTFVYYRRAPFDINKFDSFVARHWPKSVIRAKGMVYFEDQPDICYVFEQAGKQVSMRNAGQWYATMPEDELQKMMARDEKLRRDWDEVYGDRMIKLVFIGQNMDRETIARELDCCLEG